MKKTIFENNKSFEEVLVEGILFAFGTSVCLLIVASFIIGVGSFI